MCAYIQYDMCMNRLLRKPIKDWSKRDIKEKIDTNDLAISVCTYNSILITGMREIFIATDVIDFIVIVFHFLLNTVNW